MKNSSWKVRQIRNCQQKIYSHATRGYSRYFYLRFIKKQMNNDSIFFRFLVLETNRLTINCGIKISNCHLTFINCNRKNRDRKVFRKPTFLVSRSTETTLFARMHLL